MVQKIVTRIENKLEWKSVGLRILVENILRGMSISIGVTTLTYIPFLHICILMGGVNITMEWLNLVVGVVLILVSILEAYDCVWCLNTVVKNFSNIKSRQLILTLILVYASSILLLIARTIQIVSL